MPRHPKGASGDWFTQEVCVTEPLKLGHIGDNDSATSSTSSLDLEVSRLAQALRRIQAPVNITAVDYCRTRARFYSGLHAGNLGEFLAAGRPKWSAVRWLVVDGVSGDVLQTLALHYDLHPLAIEDCINFQRIKSVSYPGHMYITSHIWQLKKLRGKAGQHQQPWEGWQQHQQQQRQQQQGGGTPSKQPMWETGNGAAANGAETVSQQRIEQADQRHEEQNHEQQQGGNNNEWRLDIESGRAGVDSAAQVPADTDQDNDTDSSSSSNTSSDDDLISAEDTEYSDDKDFGDLESEVDDEEIAAGVRQKMGGITFGAHPNVQWAAGWLGKSDRSFNRGDSRQQGSSLQVAAQQGAQSQLTEENLQALSQQQEAVEGKLQQKQQLAKQKHKRKRDIMQDDTESVLAALEPIGIGPEADTKAAQASLMAVAAAEAFLLQRKGGNAAAAVHKAAADGAAGSRDDRSAKDSYRQEDRNRQKSQQQQQQQQQQQDDDNYNFEFADVPQGVGGRKGTDTGTVQLVLPLHASSFNYKPTRSPFRRKRIMMQQVSMFLHSSNVLISIFPGKAAGGGSTATKVAGPVLRGIRGMSSLLLESEDPGFLMQSLLRSCMCHSLPVFGQLADVVSRLDQRVLEGHAQMQMTRRLHVMFTDLAILSHSFYPTQTLLQALASSTTSIPRLAGAVAGRNATVSDSSSGASTTRSKLVNVEIAYQPRRPKPGFQHDPAVPTPAGFQRSVQERRQQEEEAQQQQQQQHDGEEVRQRQPPQQQEEEAQQQQEQHEHHRQEERSQQAEQEQMAAACNEDQQHNQSQGNAGAGCTQAKGSYTDEENRHVDEVVQIGPAESSATLDVASVSNSGTTSSGGDEPVLISDLARTYLEDLVDQAVAVSADLSALADHVAKLNELVVQSIGHTNENANMTIAVIGTVFLPLTFIAGIYGMNFDYVPELHWPLGYMYFYCLCLGVLLLALGLMWYMRLIKVKTPSWLRRLKCRMRSIWRLARGKGTRSKDQVRRNKNQLKTKLKRK